MGKDLKKTIFLVFLSAIICLGLSGSVYFFRSSPSTADNLAFDEQEATVRAIKKISPAVVNITVSENIETKILDLSTGVITVQKDKKEKGSGTGFLISADGLIITNRHVINSATNDKLAEYKVVLSTGKNYFAQLIGRDPLNDLAILKIFDKNLPFATMGDSAKLEPGMSVIAIGNALGQYRNSATKGIVSGLARDIVASDQAGNAESLGNVIQTDAEINLGNSGGPLVDLDGNVVGINVATDASGKSIGFAIPINDAKPVIKSVREVGRIVRPRLGIRYQIITPELAVEKKLARNNGAYVPEGSQDEPAVLPDSPAAKAGIKAGDIIFEVDGIKLDEKNTLLSTSQRYKPGQKIGLKIQRGSSIFSVIVVLDEFKQ